MTYYNPILAYGPEAFVRDAVGAGVDGVITVDLPSDEAVDLSDLCRAGGLDFVPLIAPTSTDDRIRQACRIASGFVYCVSVAGVTGARRSLPEGLEEFLQRVRRETDLPLGVGFGISTREHVAALRGKAEAAIVGSALVDVIESSPLDELGVRVRDYVEVLTGRTKART